VPTYTGTAALTLPALTLSGSGAHTAPTYTGSGALTLPALTVAGTGAFAAGGFPSVTNPEGTWDAGEAGDWAGELVGTLSGGGGRKGTWGRELVGTLSGGKRGDWS
jgi:hypothetical protein